METRDGGVVIERLEEHDEGRRIRGMAHPIPGGLCMLDAVLKLAEAFAVLRHARSVRGELFKLPHVENIFCSLSAARLNSCRP